MDQTTKTTIWKLLEEHATYIQLQRLTNNTTTNQDSFSASACQIQLDYTNQHITTKTLELLCSLAKACNLQDNINSLMRGDKVNASENRPALHTALRAPGDAPIWVDDHNIMPDIMKTREQMRCISEQIRNKQWHGFSGKPITDIVNIGIGGSDLGPRFGLQALKEFASKELDYHFIPDADPNSFKYTVEKLNPETTLFIIASKSFTTQETLYNAKKAINWIGFSKPHEKHFIAVTANLGKAHQFGITTVLPIWEWIGGRYSFCSAINLITAIAVGFEQFNQLLDGAHSMDKHFQTTDFASNLPVLLALIGIWNNNFLHIHNLLMLTYALQLKHFVPYIKQLDMESNGKSMDNQGRAVNHATGPIVWGGEGNQALHSYYQLLCQGTHRVSADFISLKAFDDEMVNLICNDKIHVLTSGIHEEENPSGYIPGNIPLNHIHINNSSAFTIGALIALYEHKVFVQSVIWGINCFDQPGVESSKWKYKQKTIIA